MTAHQRSFAWVALVVMGCAAGTTDDFFKVGELPDETATTSDDTGGKQPAGGAASVLSNSASNGSDAVSASADSSGASLGTSSSTASSAGGAGDTTSAGTGGTGGASDVSAASGGSSASGAGGTGGVGGDSAGGGGTGGTGGSGGSSAGGNGGSGGSDEPVVYVHEFEEEDDCVAVQCPADAPNLVACDITFTYFFEQYYCLALEDDGVVFIKSGNSCTAIGSSIAAGSTITCSSEPLAGDITSDECVTNKTNLDLVSDRCDCEGSAYISGC